jgi:hypothetical protein
MNAGSRKGPGTWLSHIITVDELWRVLPRISPPLDDFHPRFLDFHENGGRCAETLQTALRSQSLRQCKNFMSLRPSLVLVDVVYSLEPPYMPNR